MFAYLHHDLISFLDMLMRRPAASSLRHIMILYTPSSHRFKRVRVSAAHSPLHDHGRCLIRTKLSDERDGGQSERRCYAR